MKDDAIFDKIKEILVEQLGIDEDDINMDSNFTDELNADSLDIVELVMAMEQEFGISILRKPSVSAQSEMPWTLLRTTTDFPVIA